MKERFLWNQYLQRYAVNGSWILNAGSTEDISQVVVIPAYAEKEVLFSTLRSLAQNQASSLNNAFVLCVINNREKSPDEVKINNQQTLAYLRCLVGRRSLHSVQISERLKEQFVTINDAGLRLGYVDASSAGYALPDNTGGVGLARKIGMDHALTILQKSPSRQKLIVSLDADTLVQNNYLAAISNFFTKKVKTAVIAYEHQEPIAEKEKAAIYCYEIFLRYWVLGLHYAKSPYAYHSIGSAMVCSADAYLDVRGMNRREAGEDFYFLNKLAKIGPIKYIQETCVYPSARSSLRVPFGTGKRIHRFLAGEKDEYFLYNPQVFEILSQFLLLMDHAHIQEGEEILDRAKMIDPCLVSFLHGYHFVEIWAKMRKNANHRDTLSHYFTCWFDGFKTLKLINYLSREFYPPVHMFKAVPAILKMMAIEIPEFISFDLQPQLSQQKKILHFLRKIT